MKQESLQQNKIERAQLLDAMTQTRSARLRSENTQKRRLLELDYPDLTEKAKRPGVQAQQENQKQALARIEAQYGAEKARQAKQLLNSKLHNAALISYILDHIDRAGLSRSATDKEIAERFGMVEKTYSRLRNSRTAPSSQTLWQAAVALELSPQEANDFLAIARNHMTEFDCILFLCLQLAEMDAQYRAPDKINEMLAHWFGDSDPKHQLYSGDYYPQLP